MQTGVSSAEAEKVEEGGRKTVKQEDFHRLNEKRACNFQ